MYIVEDRRTAYRKSSSISPVYAKASRSRAAKRSPAEVIPEGLEDSAQMFELLTDRILVKGMFREWRKAVFRMLDCGLRLFDIAVDDTREHLDDDLPPVSMPITLYY